MSQIEELRRIIVGANSERLNELKSRIENIEQRTADVAEVLSPAITQNMDSGNDALLDSLQQPVSATLKRAIRAEPKEYAEILYPVMAPSIRRAISQAISSMMVTINKVIESATTTEGLKLRIQSIRTGVPYGELALRSTLLYRVEHVYLIDRETGLLIKQVDAPSASSLDSDAVSAMFSAIQSFVQDSFSTGRESLLSDVKVGEHTLWVVHGRRAMLVCVILGEAPETLKRQLEDTLDHIRSHYANPIADFEGDNRGFDGVDAYMKPLLHMQLKEAASGADKSRPNLIAAGLGLVMLIVLAYLLFQWGSSRAELSTVRHILSKTPGVAVTQVALSNDRIMVSGLKDPDARIPYTTLESYGIDKDQLALNMTPFRSLETEMELLRFRNELDLPSGVDLRVGDHIVELHGEAPFDWLLRKNERLRQLAADRRLSTVDLSASFESVRTFLGRRFSNDELSRLKFAKEQTANQTVVKLGGAMPETRLALLNAMLASNVWVEVQVASE